MQEHAWIQTFPASITVCDTEGIILEMNDASARQFEKYGGRSLIGSSLVNCHPEPSRTKLKKMLFSKEENIYSTEKNGSKNMIYQTPWYRSGKYAGFVEIIMPIPMDTPHFVRD